MDVLTACDISLSGSLDVRYDLKQSYAKQIQHCNNNMNATTEDSVMEKLGNALTRILRVHDAQLQLLSGCSSHLPNGKDVNVDQSENSNVNVDQSEHSNATDQESSNTSNLASLNIKDQVLNTSSDTESHMNAENLVCTHPISPKAPKKLVSAMKGSREALGIPKKKLTVTWDPDVYDPPVTSVSHSVKSHGHHRSRSKKSSKHKHKGKSSQGSSSSSSSKRYPKHAGKSDSHSKSYTPLEKLPFADYSQPQSPSKISDMNVNDQKCSSIYFGTSLPTVRIPVTEAT